MHDDGDGNNEEENYGPEPLIEKPAVEEVREAINQLKNNNNIQNKLTKK